MLFNTTTFAIFFLVVLAAFYLSPLGWRKYVLLAASYYFYGSWNLKFLGLLLGVTAMDYLAGLWIARNEGPRRRLILIVSLTANLLVLAFFKYFHFLTAHRFSIEIVLPIGISFHIFQSMSYVVDVYRRQQAPVPNPIDYALFLAFFPQLVAGPIVRAKQFFEDLSPWRPPTAEDLSRGCFLIALGLTKKMAFADTFSKVADLYFNDLPAHPGILDAWSGAVAFALQIYFDFSGYTDMAIGIAKLLGFHFPVNFRRPYLSVSITEFWRRWHISLSSWLRDYLYISLGGNRGPVWKTYRNLLLTMLLGGLWHGASWNFIIWGAYHGVLLAIERAFGWDKSPSWAWPLRALITFVLVLHGWIFFRAQTLADSVLVIEHLWRGPQGSILLEAAHFYLIGMAFLISCAEEWGAFFERVIHGPRWAYAVTMGFLLVVLEIFAVTDAEIPFVYFQF